MGISGSLVLGVPIGMLIRNAYGWRAPFVLIASMSALAILGITVFLEKLMFTALSKRRFSFSEKFKSN
jgi:DHA1 family purine base/nucleoside efflux pump-like MFS transporter